MSNFGVKTILNRVIALTFLTIIGGDLMAVPQEVKSSLYEYSAKSISGEIVPLKEYDGGVALVVNTASNCGFTSQYADLQEIYQRYKERGFTVLAFPSNDFGGQEPGTNSEIASFCSGTYNVTFPLFEKDSVKGEAKQEIFTYLTESGNKVGEIKWNFEKFLIDSNGKVVRRFSSSVRPNSEEITASIEQQLSGRSS